MAQRQSVGLEAERFRVPNLGHLVFPIDKEIIQQVARWLSSLGMLIGKPLPPFVHKTCLILLITHSKHEYLVLALGEETAAHAVVDSIVWEFRRLKKPMSLEINARSFAFYRR